jgi:carnitine monooxygenase subunit
MVFASTGGWKYVEENQLPLEQWPFKYMTLNVYFIFPNAIFLPDANGTHLLRMYPDENQPGRSRTHHSHYNSSVSRKAMKDRGEEKQMATDFSEFNRIILDEDYVAAASTQRSASSGAQTHLTFGRNEPALHHYHNAHRRGLGLPELELIV